MQYFGINFIY
jgi:hypothetical protein